MATLSIRQKLISYLATADDSKVKAIYTLLEADITDPSFALSTDQLAILDREHDLHLAGQSKSYNRVEALDMIKGLKGFE